jgi:hypothetical protein
MTARRKAFPAKESPSEDSPELTTVVFGIDIVTQDIRFPGVNSIDRHQTEEARQEVDSFQELTVSTDTIRRKLAKRSTAAPLARSLSPRTGRAFDSRESARLKSGDTGQKMKTMRRDVPIVLRQPFSNCSRQFEYQESFTKNEQRATDTVAIRKFSSAPPSHPGA